MTADQINSAVAAFREQEMTKVHAKVNSTPFWRQNERLAAELQALDARTERYRASLGVPDDQPEVTQSIAQDQADEPPVPTVKPGAK
ncbi:hypothetical protein AWB69_05979 [Caballeronia udeis]|uniref:Uncharacterized protein n=1 Tax=Caballeronia udeis TaxID=1232866 RepID=A0A158IGP3_9BURK|nr:hypothetical protein [Caballeronia udeis]SAL55647.1 hypothetical protein AWB69_05979 [Caballeronia udeis]